MADANVSSAAKSLLLSEYHGVLSTHSVNMPGYPFGSVAPYCLDANGYVVILISSIAQHTKNIEQDKKVSLIVTEGEVDDIHTAARLTLLCEAQKIDSADYATQQRYYRFFPPAQEYHRQHNFEFYRLHAVRARYIGGFGKIHWVDAEDLLLQHSFTGDEEANMVEHMNEDHSTAIEKYCADFKVNFSDQDSPLMVGIDCQGCNLRVGERISRIPFPQTVPDAMGVRKQLVAMAKAGI